MINSIVISGIVGKKEVKEYNGAKFVVLRIAVNDGFGENKLTYWFTVKVNAPHMSNYVETFVNVGDLMFVRGKMVNKMIDIEGRETAYWQLIAEQVELVRQKKSE